MKVLTIDELYDIFETEQYDQFRKEFGGDVFMKRNSRKKPTLVTGIFYLGGSESLLYQHIVAEKLLAANLQDDDWRRMCAYFPPVIMQIIYLWMHPLTWIEEPEKEGMIVQGKAAKEQYAKERWTPAWNRLNILIDSAILNFADDLPCSDYDDSWGGSIKNVHLWEFITANTFEQAVKIMHDDTCDWGKYKNYKRFNEHALRRSIMLIAEKRNGQKAADILQLLQNEWSSIKTWKAMDIDKLTKTEVQQFEHCLFHGFDLELQEWKKESVQTNAVLHPTLRNSFYNKLKDVYVLLVTENYVMPNIEEKFIKAMTFQLQPDERIIWKGKKYELASFINYAFEGAENRWYAAYSWTVKGKNVGSEDLKNVFNKSAKDNSVALWKERFKKI